MKKGKRMEQGITNGIFLIFAAVFLAARFSWKWFSRLNDGMQFTVAENPAEDARRLYKKKTWYRLGVLICSICALIAMYVSYSRYVPCFFIILAGCSQIGVMRHSTRKAFARALEQKIYAGDQDSI